MQVVELELAVPQGVGMRGSGEPRCGNLAGLVPDLRRAVARVVRGTRRRRGNGLERHDRLATHALGAVRSRHEHGR